MSACDDLRMFRFVEAQTRLERAAIAKDAAEAERRAAEDQMHETFASLTLDEQQRVNDAYYFDRQRAMS